MPFDISLYDFDLPEENIAQHPTANRGESRLLHVNCKKNAITDGSFSSLLNLINPEDILVVNNTRVFPARLLGRKETGGKIELMLLHYPEKDIGVGSFSISGSQLPFGAKVQGLLRSSKRPKIGARLLFGPDLEGVLREIKPDATVVVELLWEGELNSVLQKYGNMPLPPYIRRDSGSGNMDRLRYQTVYADQDGAVAAPTAGLHFTDDFLGEVRRKGVEVADITLHVGYGTFSPVRVDDIRDHKIHSEFISVPARTVVAINKAREVGGKVWAVGTTTTRALEFAADGNGGVVEKQGDCDIYIYPGFEFKVVDNLITNFHLPKSSLLFMVSAFSGRELMLKAYSEALGLGYRFYSYGDAMVITK